MSSPTIAQRATFRSPSDARTCPDTFAAHLCNTTPRTPSAPPQASHPRERIKLQASATITKFCTLETLQCQIISPRHHDSGFDMLLSTEPVTMYYGTFDPWATALLQAPGSSCTPASSCTPEEARWSCHAATGTISVAASCILQAVTDSPRISEFKTQACGVVWDVPENC